MFDLRCSRDIGLHEDKSKKVMKKIQATTVTTDIASLDIAGHSTIVLGYHFEDDDRLMLSIVGLLGRGV